MLGNSVSNSRVAAVHFILSARDDDQLGKKPFPGPSNDRSVSDRRLAVSLATPTGTVARCVRRADVQRLFLGGLAVEPSGGLE